MMPHIIILYYRLLHTSHTVGGCAVTFCCSSTPCLLAAGIPVLQVVLYILHTSYIGCISYLSVNVLLALGIPGSWYQYTCTIEVDLVNPQVLTEQEQDELPVGHIDSGTVDERVSQRFRYVYVSLSSFLFRLCSRYPQLVW